MSKENLCQVDDRDLIVKRRHYDTLVSKNAELKAENERLKKEREWAEKHLDDTLNIGQIRISKIEHLKSNLTKAVELLKEYRKSKLGMLKISAEQVSYFNRVCAVIKEVE